MLVKHFIFFEPHSCHMLGGRDCSPHLEFRVNLPEGLLCTLTNSAGEPKTLKYWETQELPVEKTKPPSKLAR